ncbi:hypothetical protein J7I98_04220 [Streptomyces sp. ISL-98]|uniref:hypothetical protein n=1 Tax=Streptomyces sp. ISL-98 TaxID=2819192 RepID=UPI001BE8971B|nr:hypothetical protein [Streptomyces sp. ISL-98]MBT2505113.1 hypothetical protein [Streptomyces sp. ISL-98]
MSGQSREERRALLGDDVIADIQRQVAAAPPPPPHVIAELRRILTRPAARTTPRTPARRAA